ncbi:MAG TPA: protein kinase [Pyrinomonadaceae bacterium]|nr:protein kinase [Pyrinomonadaceae bacterium]
MLNIGKNLGHYKLQSAIGAGGMGEIYRARDTRLRRDVAIKILPEKLTQNSAAVERFRREAHAASALNHPNILTIYDIGEYENIQFITTEFVDGQTLRERIKSAPLSLVETLDISVQVAGALAAAHDAGIIHRDIKPENIMLRGDGYVKVLDFGIAKLIEMRNEKAENNPQSAIPNPQSTSPGMIIGTAAYMSPEQARGLEVDMRSDIFSLGVVVYEMLSGCLPFSGATMSDVIAAILKSEPKPLSECVKNVPSELEWIISKALKKERDERYQTIKGLLEDLTRLKQRLNFEIELQRVSNSGLTKKISFSEQATLLLPLGAFQNTNLTRSAGRRTRKAIDSLAVLPLVNAADSDSEYLSDGITECIINSLSKLPKLRVLPRSTVFRYKGQETDLLKVGNELGVRAVFAGRIVQIGDSVVVKAELVDVANEAQIWGEQYRRKMTNIFNLLEDIAEDISEQLRLKLTGEEKKKLAKRYTKNTEAYQLYLKGRYFVTTKRTEEWIKKGIECFQKAIELDPNYALAYSGIAEAYGFLASSTGGWSPHKAYPMAKAAAHKALEIDDTLGEAHCSLGFFRLLYDWDFSGAEREFKKALQLNPNYPNAHDGYGFYLKALGRHEEAIEKCKQVQRLDPLSPFAHVSLGYAYYFARDYEKAIEECNKALELDKYSTFAYRNLGLAYLQLGKLENAINSFCKSVTFSGGSLTFESYLGLAYALAGKQAQAAEVLEKLKETAKERYVPAYNFAMIYLGLNEQDKIFEWLEKSFEERSGYLPFLKVEPMFDSLHADSRFQDLLWQIDLLK